MAPDDQGHAASQRQLARGSRGAAESAGRPSLPVDAAIPLMSRSRILFLNRSYWPDAEATGQLLTELCEDLVPSFDVTVIAGQPNDNPTDADFCRRGTEFRNGVRIRRVRHTR